MKDTIIIRKYKNKFTYLKFLGWVQTFMVAMAYLIYKKKTEALLDANLAFTFFVLAFTWVLYFKCKNERDNIIDLEIEGEEKKTFFTTLH